MKANRHEDRRNSERFDRYYLMSARRRRVRQSCRLAGRCHAPVSSGELYSNAIEICLELSGRFLELFEELTGCKPYKDDFCKRTHEMQSLYNAVARYLFRSRRSYLTDADLREWFLYAGGDLRGITAFHFHNDRVTGELYGRFVKELLSLRHTEELYDSVYLAAIKVLAPNG